jgi:hypothetical protein
MPMGDNLGLDFISLSKVVEFVVGMIVLGIKIKDGFRSTSISPVMSSVECTETLLVVENE